MVPKEAPKEIYSELAKSGEQFQQYLIGREIKKEIVVPNKMVSLVTGVAPNVGGPSQSDS
jgi:leucyl-tRNA synthetase